MVMRDPRYRFGNPSATKWGKFRTMSPFLYYLVCWNVVGLSIVLGIDKVGKSRDPNWRNYSLNEKIHKISYTGSDKERRFKITGLKFNEVKEIIEDKCPENIEEISS